jgi:hypothetical protein
LPTNRSKKQRKRTAGTAEISEAARYFRLLHLMPKTSPWAAGKSKQEIRDFWKKHRAEILREDDRQRQALGKPFRRPSIYMDEIEREHPRRQVGTETWWGPWTAAGAPTEPETDAVYEDDRDYLKRLGLLAGWELEAWDDISTRSQNGD